VPELGTLARVDRADACGRPVPEIGAIRSTRYASAIASTQPGHDVGTELDAEVTPMARRPDRILVAWLASVVRWWRRGRGLEAMALDLSPMVATDPDLADAQARRRPAWPRGVQEDDDVHWHWDRVDPATGTRTGAEPRAPDQG
jgi:hypothetical protein